MSQVTFSVPEIHCGHCKSTIEDAVRPLDGVRDVTVDVEGRTVAVDFAEPANTALISAAIADAGYDVAALVSES